MQQKFCLFVILIAETQGHFFLYKIPFRPNRPTDLQNVRRRFLRQGGRGGGVGTQMTVRLSALSAGRRFTPQKYFCLRLEAEQTPRPSVAGKIR
jgi:hypothetical protein